MRIRRSTTTGALALAAVMSFSATGTAVAAGGQQDVASPSVTSSGSCPEVRERSADARVDRARVDRRSNGSPDDGSATRFGSTFMLRHGTTSRCLATEDEGLLLAPCSGEAANQRWERAHLSLRRAGHLSAVVPEMCVSVEHWLRTTGDPVITLAS